MGEQPASFDAFVQHLATLKPDEVERALASAKLKAVNLVADDLLEPPVRTLNDYLASDIAIPPVLVGPAMCVRGGLNATIGRSGKGKTVFSLNRALRWAAGLPLFSTWVDKDNQPHMAPIDFEPLKVMVVENEGAAGMFHRTMGVMMNAPGYLTDDDRKLAGENVLVWGEGGYSGLKLDDPTRTQELRRGVEKWKPDLVFIEPFRSLWSGEENSATEMAIVVDNLIGIAADYDCGVWISHHEKKGGAGEDDKMSASRGSTVLENFVTVMENFEQAKGGDFREVSWSKSRYEVAPNPVRLVWNNQAWWYDHVPEEAIEEAVTLALRTNVDEPMSLKELVAELEEPESKLRKVLKKMAEGGKIKQYKSVSDGFGSTGARYGLPRDENFERGGLAV
jgi:hypothetical protein